MENEREHDRMEVSIKHVVVTEDAVVLRSEYDVILHWNGPVGQTGTRHKFATLTKDELLILKDAIEKKLANPQ